MARSKATHSVSTITGLVLAFGFLILMVTLALVTLQSRATTFVWPFDKTTSVVEFSGMIVTFCGAVVAGLSLMGIVVTIGFTVYHRNTRDEFVRELEEMRERTFSIEEQIRKEVLEMREEARSTATALREGALELRERYNTLQSDATYVKTVVDHWKDVLQTPEAIQANVESAVLKTIFGKYVPADQLREHILAQIRSEFFRTPARPQARRRRGGEAPNIAGD